VLGYVHNVYRDAVPELHQHMASVQPGSEFSLLLFPPAGNHFNRLLRRAVAGCSPDQAVDRRDRRFCCNTRYLRVTRPANKSGACFVRHAAAQDLIVFQNLLEANKLFRSKPFIIGIVDILQVDFKRTLVNQPDLPEIRSSQPTISEQTT